MRLNNQGRYGKDLYAYVIKIYRGDHRDVSRGMLLPVNWYGIPNFYPKLIKN